MEGVYDKNVQNCRDVPEMGYHNLYNQQCLVIRVYTNEITKRKKRIARDLRPALQILILSAYGFPITAFRWHQIHSKTHRHSEHRNKHN